MSSGAEARNTQGPTDASGRVVANRPQEQVDKISSEGPRIPDPSYPERARGPKDSPRQERSMLMTNERRPAIQTLRGWAISVLQDAGAICECKEQG
jgi:hypothetical protein